MLPSWGSGGRWSGSCSSSLPEDSSGLERPAEPRELREEPEEELEKLTSESSSEGSNSPRKSIMPICGMKDAFNGQNTFVRLVVKCCKNLSFCRVKGKKEQVQVYKRLLQEKKEGSMEKTSCYPNNVPEPGLWSQ